MIAVWMGKHLCGPWPQPCLGTPAEESRGQVSALSLLCSGNTPPKDTQTQGNNNSKSRQIVLCMD